MTTTAPTPNRVLRAVRIDMGLSQDDFAAALRRAGDELGEPNKASRRLVERWESGTSTTPRAGYIRALERVTGMTAENLGIGW